MSGSKTNVNAYSPEGRLFQVEYAMKAMNLGTTTIGIKTKDFALLVSEKKIISKLQNPKSIKKHFKISEHIALGFAGISADVKLIVEKARSFILEHEHLYNENCKIERLLEYLGDLSLNFDDEDNRIFSRPFGVSILIIGYDDQPRLYSLDPSGSYIEYKTKAIGSGNEVVENLLESRYQTYTDFDTTLKGAINMMKDVMKEKISNINVEVMVVNKDGMFMLTPEQLNEFIN